MKVLQVNSVCGVGSTGRIATDIHKILIEKGHESYIAYGRGKPKNCNNTIRIGTNSDNYFHVFLTRLFDKHGFGSKNATKKFISEIKKVNPDVIHLHNIHGYYINIELLFDYLIDSKKPVVWTLHDCWSFTGHCAHFDYIECYKWQDECSKCPNIRKYPKSVVKDNSKRNYVKKKKLFTNLSNLTLVTPSKWLSRFVEKSYLKDFPIKVINNGIDLKVFKPTKSNFIMKNNLQGKFVLLGVSNVWNDKKGFDFLLKLSKQLKSDEIIILVGLKENQLSLLPNNIIGITHTENPQKLAEIYSACNVFINPTYEDNFPTTNIESLACGLPVIAFDTGGCSEVINQLNGAIIKPGDYVELRHQINLMKTYSNVFSSSSLVEYVVERYNCDDRFEDYTELYKEVVFGESTIFD